MKRNPEQILTTVKSKGALVKEEDQAQDYDHDDFDEDQIMPGSTKHARENKSKKGES